MTLEKGFLMISFCQLSALQRLKLFMNFLVVLLSPVKMGGGFPLRAPLLGLLMTLILCVSCSVCPVAMLISSCCPTIVVLMDNWGCMAVAGIVSRGIGIPCWTADSIWGRIGFCSVNGLLPWRVAI